MLGLILLLVLKDCSSDAVQATVGSTITLECTVSGSSYQWQKHLGTHWGNQIHSSSKYGNATTGFLTIYNINVGDAGTYRCTKIGDSEQSSITLAVTDTVGTWTPWSQWTMCSKTCGVGTSTRNRVCTAGNCDGSDVDSLYCATTSCPDTDGTWTPWSQWTTCSKTCGGGTSTRHRGCPVAKCGGSGHESMECATTPCPVNGNWGVWGAWNSCSTTCGDGILTRHRSCDNPVPAHGGSGCQGNGTGSTPCFTTPCPVHGNWGAWHDWHSCSATCGSGSRSRYQECNNPEPANGGSDCQGNDTEIESCSIKLCPVPSAEDNSSASVGIGAGIGSTVVVIGLLIGLFVVLKRYRLGKPADSPIYTTAGDTESSNADLHIYSELQQNTASPTHRQNGVIYDNLIIWKKANSC